MLFSQEQYRTLITPRSIALVGVTSRIGPNSNNPLEMLLNSGYNGKIFAINPHADEILGIKVYRSVLELPEIPELAVICAPRDAVPALFKDCVKQGIKLVIIVAQGFSDGDRKGMAMQRRIMELARRENVRILGPNTLGVVNNLDNFSTSFMKFISRPAPVGVLCQSGIFMTASARFSGGIGIGIDTGNTADLDFADILEYLADDSRIKVINLHMEGINNGRKFMTAAARVTPRKPILVMKTGRSAAGARAAGSHTGSLAGEDIIFDAAFKQTGVIRVHDVEELSDYSRVFSTLPLMRGTRVGVVTITGGGGIIAADACERYGLITARYSEQTIQVLRELFPSWMEPGNPVDVWPASMLHGYASVYRKALEAVLADPGVDGVICITAAWTADNFLDISDTIARAADTADKPVTLWALGSRWRTYADKLEQRGTLVAFPTADRAARSLAALYRQHCTAHRDNPQQPDYSRAYVAAGSTSSPDCGTAPVTGETKLLDAGRTWQLLEKYSIPVARWGAAADREQALALAAQIGYPVVLKVDSPLVAHKSDIGGVILNIIDRQSLCSAWDKLMTAAHIACPAAPIKGAIIQQYLTGGSEILLGGKYDPQFGPVVVCGSGGIYTEIIGDTALRIPPLTPQEILAMLRETKLYRMLKGARGIPPADMDKLIDVIAGFCRLILEELNIKEIDINPLLAGPHGAVALDARIYTI